MNILVASDYEEMSRLAADMLLARLAWNPNALFGLSLGATPKRTYQLLAERVAKGPVDSDNLRILKINEWMGLAGDDPASCESHIRKHVLDPMKVTMERYFGFRADAQDSDSECRRIREVLRQEGPIDVAVLGLGLNGHLGWNEPGDTLARSVHVSELEETTQQHSLLGGAEHPPNFGFTLGMGDLLQARHVLLLVQGSVKAEQMRRLMGRDITTDFPASLLWTHPDAVCICDKEAYALCTGSSAYHR